MRRLLFAVAGLFTAATSVAGEIMLFEYPDFAAGASRCAARCPISIPLASTIAQRQWRLAAQRQSYIRPPPRWRSEGPAEQANRAQHREVFNPCGNSNGERTSG